MNIRLFTIGGTEIRISLFTVPFLLFFICAGFTRIMIITLFAMCLHELCHVICARKLCVAIKAIDITPSGFSAHIDETECGLSDILKISSAGVIFSLVSGIAYIGIADLFNIKSTVSLDFAQVSVVIGALNLLPVTPLDGGRMLHSFLHSFLYDKTADTLCKAISLVISLSAVFFSIYGLIKDLLNYSAVIISALMLAGSISQLKKRKRNEIISALSLSKSAAKGNRLPVKLHAFSGNACIKDVLSDKDSGKYNYIAVIDENLHTKGILDECDLLYAETIGCKTLNEALRIKKNPSCKMLNGNYKAVGSRQ